jgi:hypothetical protein
MLDKETRQTIIQLNNIGKSKREISNILQISRNTIKNVLLQGVDLPKSTLDTQGIKIMPILREVFSRCLGNAVRIHEILKAEYNFAIAYSTLTKLIQDANLRKPIRRVGEYVFAPGEEMQHDTSPHDILIGDKKIRAQCASLVFGYSRKIFIHYYPCFTRFEAKTFLKAGFEFMQGCCQRCVIDNTSVILASGSGSDAIFSPEMNTFSRMYGFVFFAHRVKNPDRKGKVERPFYYVETNFLVGRTFKSWDDLNLQAIQWCLYANQKEKRELGMSPECAYVQEKPHLIPLPEISPPIYEHYQRLVDSKGFINLDANRYSAPENLIGRTLDVYKYPEEVRLFFQHNEVAVHRRLAGRRCEVSRIPAHHIKHHAHKTKQAANAIEAILRSHNEFLDLYISDLKKHVYGRGMRAMNKLLNFKHTYPEDAFLQAIKQAHKYGLYDLNRLEELIIKSVAGNYFNLREE